MTDPTSRNHSGKLADPSWREDRAKNGAAGRHSARTYARSIVAQWPKLDQATRDEVRDILRPAVWTPREKTDT